MKSISLNQSPYFQLKLLFSVKGFYPNQAIVVETMEKSLQKKQESKIAIY